MGNWHMSVEGVGSHHNENNPTDADKLFEKFVSELKKIHSVNKATFTYGGSENTLVKLNALSYGCGCQGYCSCTNKE